MEKDEIIQLLKFRVETLEKENKELKKRIPNSQKKITGGELKTSKTFFFTKSKLLIVWNF